MCIADPTMIPAHQHVVGQQSTCWLQSSNHCVLSYVLRQRNRHYLKISPGQCGLRRSSHSLRAQQITGHGSGKFPTRVSAAAAVSSTSYSSNTSASAAPQQYVQHPHSPQVYPSKAAGQGAVTVTWPGLLAALGLAATALVAAATTCFFLYIKPVMQAMSVTLAEMETAAKEMQQAAQEVEELVGGINNTIKLLMQPTALLKWTSSMPNSTTTTTTSTSPQSSTDDNTYAPAADTSSTSGGITSTSNVVTAAAAAAAAPPPAPSAVNIPSSIAARQLTDQLESLGPNLLEGLKALQKLQLSDLGLVALKLSGLEDAPGKQQQQAQQQEEEQQQRQTRSRQRRALRTAAQATSSSSCASTSTNTSSSSTSSSRMVWDMLASSLTTRSTRRSLARLRSDLAAAANVLTVLLAPPSRGLYEQMQQDEQQQQLGSELRQEGSTQQQQQGPQQDGQQQQQQQQQSVLLSQVSIASDNVSSRPAGSHRLKSDADTSTSSTSSSRSTAGRAKQARRSMQLDEWGLPVTSAEAAAAGKAGAGAVPAIQASVTDGFLNSNASTPAAALSPSRSSSSSSGHQQQQQQQRMHRHLGHSSGEDDSWHLELSQYGSYLEQEHLSVTANKDNGITMQQLQQDSSLMQRVFCDNQELAFTQQQEQKQQQQQQPRQSQQEQQEAKPQPGQQNGTTAADS